MQREIKEKGGKVALNFRFFTEPQGTYVRWMKCLRTLYEIKLLRSGGC